MQIIVHKKMQFRNTNIVENSVTKEKVASDNGTVTVSSSPHAQIVPDWVVNDGLFALALAENPPSIIVVVPAKGSGKKAAASAAAPAPASKPAEPPAPVKATPVTLPSLPAGQMATGWGATPATAAQTGLPAGQGAETK